MALFVVLACVNFTSCDKEGDDDSTFNPSNGKKIAKMMGYDENGEIELKTEFKYNEDGTIAEIIEDFHDKQHDGEPWYKDVWKFDWYSKDSIVVTFYNNSFGTIKESKETFILLNGKIIKDNTYTYTYNDNGNIVEAKIDEWRENNSWKKDATCTWENDELYLIEYRSSNGSYDTNSIHYGNNTCTGFFPFLFDYIAEYHDCNLHMAHPELFGAKTTRMPTKITGGGKVRAFEFELDADGYIIGCIENVSYISGYGGSYSFEYKFVWE